jgi:nitroimidazol reductase NimA-like FMN-containing flavoprotein (pyridoxamine 5'-phosphate oxidase superfamily)
MTAETPLTELHAGFSSPGASATEWALGRRSIEAAQVFWLSTVRPDGRPHVTPLLSVFLDSAMYFCTGRKERKARNLEHNRHCILTTGQNSLDGGLDVVVEGVAAEISDSAELAAVAASYESKYGERFTAPEGTWFGLSDAIRNGLVLVYRVAPTTVLGFARGEEFSQTRWSFG